MSDWFVYILRCNDNTLYTGVTTDLDRRLSEHNSAGSTTRYTRSRQPVVLAYQEHATNRSDACRREAAIKRLTKAEKSSLIG